MFKFILSLMILTLVIFAIVTICFWGGKGLRFLLDLIIPDQNTMQKEK